MSLCMSLSAKACRASTCPLAVPQSTSKTAPAGRSCGLQESFNQRTWPHGALKSNCLSLACITQSSRIDRPPPYHAGPSRVLCEPHPPVPPRRYANLRKLSGSTIARAATESAVGARRSICTSRLLSMPSCRRRIPGRCSVGGTRLLSSSCVHV